MRVIFQKGPLAVLGLMGLSFLLLMLNFAPAEAFSPTVSHTAKGSSIANQTSLGVALTVSNAGDTIVAEFSSTSSVSASTSSLVSTMTDSASSVYAQQVGNSVGCIDNNPGIQCITNSDGALDEEIWTASAQASGAVTVTVTSTTGATLTLILLDIANVAPTKVAGSSGTCATVGPGTNNICTVTSVNTAGSVAYGAGQIAIGGSTSIPGWISGGGTGYTYLNQGTGNAEYSTTAASPTNFHFTAVTDMSSFVDTGIILSGGSVTVTSSATTTINTNCLGGCTGGSNGTSTYFSTAIPPLFVFYASQNIASAGQIDNFTMKVKAVHINAATGNLLIGVYMPATPTTAPSGGNQYSLVKSLTYPISNGTTDFFIHQNPQADICASCFYAVGIMATTTASRGSGATGSGVSFYETSTPSSLQYSFNPGGINLPTSFFSSTIQKPNFFMFIHETYTVAIITTTTTQTLSGTVSTTVTVTSTNTVNQLDMSKAGFWFMPLLFLLAPMALLIVVKRVADGR